MSQDDAKKIKEALESAENASTSQERMSHLSTVWEAGKSHGLTGEQQRQVQKLWNQARK